MTKSLTRKAFLPPPSKTTNTILRKTSREYVGSTICPPLTEAGVSVVSRVRIQQLAETAIGCSGSDTLEKR